MADGAVFAQHARTAERFDRDEAQNAYPIIAVEREGYFQVMDGNRRTLQAFLHNEQTITAWVARTADDHMMQIVDESQRYPAQLAAYQQIAANWFAESKPALLAYQRRVMGMKGAELLLPENLRK
jgi:hypothetical protein